MSAHISPSFAKRSRRIVRNNRALARGADLHIGPDGLLVMRPRSRFSGLPLRGLVIVVGVLFLAKALMLAHAGTADYDRRVDVLARGNAVEKAGAFVMQSDPLSAAVAAQIAPLMK